MAGSSEQAAAAAQKAGADRRQSGAIVAPPTTALIPFGIPLHRWVQHVAWLKRKERAGWVNGIEPGGLALRITQIARARAARAATYRDGCTKGHAWTDESTWWRTRKNGGRYRQCRSCVRDRYLAARPAVSRAEKYKDACGKGHAWAEHTYWWEDAAGNWIRKCRECLRLNRQKRSVLEARTRAAARRTEVREQLLALMVAAELAANRNPRNDRIREQAARARTNYLRELNPARYAAAPSSPLATPTTSSFTPGSGQAIELWLCRVLVKKPGFVPTLAVAWRLAEMAEGRFEDPQGTALSEAHVYGLVSRALNRLARAGAARPERVRVKKAGRIRYMTKWTLRKKATPAESDLPDRHPRA